MSGLVWHESDFGGMRAWYGDDCIAVFESASQVDKWTWCGTGAQGVDCGHFDTLEEAKADAERWYASRTDRGAGAHG